MVGGKRKQSVFRRTFGKMEKRGKRGIPKDAKGFKASLYMDRLVS